MSSLRKRIAISALLSCVALGSAGSSRAASSGAQAPGSGVGRVEKVAPGHTPAVVRPLSAEQKALANLEQQTQQQVADLSRLMVATADPATLRDLASRIENLKFGMRIQSLGLRATFARQRGEISRAHEFDIMREALLQPLQKAPSARVIQHADKTVTEEGGRP